MMIWGCPILRNTQAYQQLNVIWKFEESSLSIPELQIAPCPEFPIIEVAHGAPWPVRSELQGSQSMGFCSTKKTLVLTQKSAVDTTTKQICLKFSRKDQYDQAFQHSYSCHET